MNLTPRPIQLNNDLIPITNFLRGRQQWQPLPPYWHTGKSRLAAYLTMYEGKASSHLLWEDEASQIQAYIYLTPDEKTLIYSTPEVREWRITLHHEQRTDYFIRTLIQDAEARLNQRASTTPITTVAYESDQDWTNYLSQHSYIKQQPLDVYMTIPLTDAIPSPIVPEGFVVRPFAGEHEIRSRASVTTSAYGGFDEPNQWSLNDIGHIQQFCAVTQTIDFVAATSEGILASSSVAFCDPVTKLGEFDPVATHQRYQQRGLAKATLLTGLHWMKGAGMQTAVIRTGVDNVPALRTYQSIGFRVADRLFVYEKRLKSN